jgi:hypothetical protein
MGKLLALFAVALLGAGSASEVFARSGYVHDLTGSATVRTGTGPTRPLRVGDIIDQGQTIQTADKSAAVVKFEDGQVMALHSGSAFTIAQYNYNKQNIGASNAVFNLVRGGLRFITGVIGSTNRNAVRLTAASATIGIRGTDGTVVLDAVTQIVTAAVNVGALTMTTPLGTQNIGIGQFVAASPAAPPSAPAPTAQATAAVAQTLNTLAAATNIPVNTPVVVEASAQAAAAQANAKNLQAQAAAQPQNQALQKAAEEAAAQAAAALSNAVQLAQQAFQQALAAGAVPPAPPAPPAPAPTPTPTPTTTPTDTTTPTTTTPTTGTGGAGGGGGGTASPN